MAYTSEIEKLEARFRENPKGRNFAPLADAYRKAGLIDNAIDLCQSGLQFHPDYVSGHIVHGRCLVDKKDDTGAEAVFRKVLDLDPENILALKVLAEIAERNERFGEAGEWLNRLLLADPMNGDAADGLSRVRGKAAAQPPPPQPAPAEPELPELELAPELEPEPVAVEEPVAAPLEHTEVAAPSAPADAADASLVVEHEELELKPADAAAQRRLSIEYMEGPFDAGIAEGPTAAMAKPEFELERTSEPPAEAGIQPFDGVDFNHVEDMGPVEGIVLDEQPELAPDPEVEVEGLARTQYEGSGVFRVDNQPPPAAAEPPEERPTSPVADLPLIMPDEVEPPAAPWPEAARPSRETEPLEAPPVPAAAAPPPFRLPDDDGAADTAALSRAEPVVTETMAELYLRQGHRDEALQVYQALSAQRPDDARLRRKVADLSAPPSRAAGSGQSAGAFLKGILSARPGARPPALSPEPPTDQAAPPPELGSDAPEEQANGPVEQAEPGGPAPGTPTRPASDSISLDSVFGEEGGRGSMPAVPEPPPEQPARLPVASGGFSFDDFFGTATVPEAGAAGKPAGSRPSRPSGRNRSPEQEEDLDQFQAWLKSLKA